MLSLIYVWVVLQIVMWPMVCTLFVLLCIHYDCFYICKDLTEGEINQSIKPCWVSYLLFVHTFLHNIVPLMFVTDILCFVYVVLFSRFGYLFHFWLVESVLWILLLCQNL